MARRVFVGPLPLWPAGGQACLFLFSFFSLFFVLCCPLRSKAALCASDVRVCTYVCMYVCMYVLCASGVRVCDAYVRAFCLFPHASFAYVDSDLIDIVISISMSISISISIIIIIISIIISLSFFCTPILTPLLPNFHADFDADFPPCCLPPFFAYFASGVRGRERRLSSYQCRSCS